MDEQYDVRFLLQTRLHTDLVFQEYDYVLFDCPPRLSTACVNALVCADYILAPTSLSQSDIEAVPRTLSWLRQLHHVVRAQFLGAIVCGCNVRSDKLIKFEQAQLANPRNWKNECVNETLGSCGPSLGAGGVARTVHG